MLLWVILLLYSASANEWLLYSTDTTYGDYDCLFYDSRFFCRRPNDGKVVRESVCYGTEWLMTDLKRNNITTDMLFEWLHPHDSIERYARFLHQLSEDNTLLEDKTICNCSSNRFGTDCSYERTTESTIEEVLLWQLSRPLEREMGRIACLVDGIQCNAGLLCLEWRQVCDGIIQCEDAIDETNCNLLEFHRCFPDEFQCHNGMCIPQTFLFDATIDCMDRSDEQEIWAIFSRIASCPTKSMFDCDEFLCKKNEISCGDGQCVHWTNVINHQQPCQNRRGAFYRCEILVGTTTYSTLGNGLCRSGQLPSMNLTSCAASVQSLLRSYKIKNSFEYIMVNCPLLIPVPSGPILTSNLKFFHDKSIIAAFYNSSISFAKHMPPLPHVSCFTGSLICNNTKITLNNDYCFGYDEFQAMSIHPFSPVSHIFCNITLTMPLK
jgi:hypothetical protein